MLTHSPALLESTPGTRSLMPSIIALMQGRKVKLKAKSESG
jgi:hypothetical protein